MKALNWTCPFCKFPQVATDNNIYVLRQEINVGVNKFGRLGYRIDATACQNIDCREVYINILLSKSKAPNNFPFTLDESIKYHTLMPEYSLKQQPSFIPKSLICDYEEACKIVNLSPKASATLARRCLQGMIRDFCGISKDRLIDEIKALKKAFEEGKAPQGVTAETIDAIDHVRDIGNIGAHMEKDINLIVDIEPNEAGALIELIEMLFDEWYVARHQRNERLKKLKQLADDKNTQKQIARSSKEESK